MERGPVSAKLRSSRRVRRWAKEIVLAALLTAVAVAFIANALLRGDQMPRQPSAFETARKPSAK
jgi:hypothetical protein